MPPLGRLARKDRNPCRLHEDFDVIRDPHRIVRAGGHALVATTDRIFFDQAARTDVFRARIGDFEESVKDGFQHRLFKLTCSRQV